MSWSGGPIKWDECILDCVNGCSGSKIRLVTTIAERVDEEYDILPLYHCDKCDSVFYGINPKLLSCVERMSRVGLSRVHHKGKGENVGNGQGYLSPMKAIKERVRTFRLK